MKGSGLWQSAYSPIVASMMWRSTGESRKIEEPGVSFLRRDRRCDFQGTRAESLGLAAR